MLRNLLPAHLGRLRQSRVVRRAHRCRNRRPRAGRARLRHAFRLTLNQNDINHAFTEKVTELLSRGYQIYPGTMGGSQGEIAHVDLYKDDEIIRVLLDHSADRGEKPDGVRLIVGRNTDRIRMNCFDTLGNTIWNNRLEILSEIEFCQIGENYYTDAETGKAIQEKRRARWEARHESVRRDLPDAFKCAALKYVQRQPRMKSCKLSVITYL